MARTPTVTVTVMGTNVDKEQTAKSLASVGQVTPVGEKRGLGSALAIGAQWLLAPGGSAGQTAGKLVDWATRQPPGTQVIVQFGGVRVEVSNASQKQVLDILNKSIEAAKVTAGL
jgi:hypothetical protein